MHKTNCMQSIEHISTWKYLAAYVLNGTIKTLAERLGCDFALVYLSSGTL